MKRLKTWQKYAFWFAFVHLVLSTFLFTFFYKGEFNLAFFFVIVFDLPVFLLAHVFLAEIYYFEWFYRIYFPIVGTIFYGFLGAFVGFLVSRYREKFLGLFK